MAVALSSVSMAAAQPAGAAPRPVSALPAPADFAPAPFALPGSRQAAQKQLCNLLRRLDAIATAEALITGSAEQPAGLKLLLKNRPGRSFTAELITTVSRLAADAVPGLPPEALLITDAAGRVLYAQGQVLTPATAPSPPVPLWVWLLATLCLAAAAKAVFAVCSRRKATPDWWRMLDAREQAGLAQALADERPEVIAVVLAQLPVRVGARLRRQLLRRRIDIVEPSRQADPQVVQIVMQSVRSRLGQYAS